MLTLLRCISFVSKININIAVLSYCHALFPPKNIKISLQSCDSNPIRNCRCSSSQGGCTLCLSVCLSAIKRTKPENSHTHPSGNFLPPKSLHSLILFTLREGLASALVFYQCLMRSDWGIQQNSAFGRAEQEHKAPLLPALCFSWIVSHHTALG